MWNQYVELGLTALPFGEDDGGIGGGPVETMIVMEAFGRSLALEPYFATHRARRRLPAAWRKRRRCARIVLPGVAAGETLLSFATSSGRRAMTSPTSPPPRRRTALLTCSTARRASRCTATSPDKIVVSARVSGEQRSQNGIGLSRRREAPGVTRRGYGTIDGLPPPKSRSRTSR